MELWIRSQDKECLTLVNHLFTNDNCEIKQQNDLVLATYKSKERALEVLDDIQSKLKQQFIVKADVLMRNKDIDKEENRLIWKYDKEFIMQDSGFEILPINNNVVIYEMPKENK